ncbi:MAG: hypothetical protein EOO27_18785 [Comamonadaceae bacterium]|nr:MAG: hypothetical protein EOO27_18785 [Comamonadaceae bacterium]
MSSTLTTAQLLELTRSPSPPQGFVAVPADRLELPDGRDLGRINYQAFFNPSTNDLVITGTPRVMERLDLVTQKKIKDTNIFSDSVRVTNGAMAGGFARAADPVTQTEALANRLTDRDNGDYPNATISFAGEGAVGLAFSAASHELRSSGSAIVGSTVTLNAWTGHWTPDGSVDADVLDVRTPRPANGDPGIGSLHVGREAWKPGANVAAVNTGNAQLAGGLADIGTQSAMALGEWVAGKVGGRVMSEGAAWMADKIVGKGAEAITAPAADAASGAAANYIDNPGRAIAALGWQANLTPAETIQVLQQGIGQGQWNVMQGLSPAGYAVDGVYYEHTGPATVAGVGSSAETRQPAVQVTTWRDDATGAIMEARLSGRQVDGAFEAGPSGVFASGMDTAGRMVLKDEFAQRVADYQMRPAASTAAAGATPEDATLAPVVVEGGRGLGNYTTVSIQTHAAGAASFEFVGEDGSRAWVMQDAATGNRAVVINSGKDVEGEPRPYSTTSTDTGDASGKSATSMRRERPSTSRGSFRACRPAHSQNRCLTSPRTSNASPPHPVA